MTTGSIPATKILAIGCVTEALTYAQRQTIMPKEVPATLRLIRAGQIEQFWSRRDGKGVIFLLNVPSVEQARTLLEALPLGQAKLIAFNLIPIGPLAPLALLPEDEAVTPH